MRLEFSIEIERSVEDIYELVGNPENDVKWQDAVVEVHKLTPGPIQTGSRFRHTLRIFGKRMGVDVEFIERQPHSGYVLQCRSAPFDFETACAVDATEPPGWTHHTRRYDRRGPSDRCCARGGGRPLAPSFR